MRLSRTAALRPSRPGCWLFMSSGSSHGRLLRYRATCILGMSIHLHCVSVYTYTGLVYTPTLCICIHLNCVHVYTYTAYMYTNNLCMCIHIHCIYMYIVTLSTRKAPWPKWRNLDRPNIQNLTLQMDDGPMDHL